MPRWKYGQPPREHREFSTIYLSLVLCYCRLFTTLGSQCKFGLTISRFKRPSVPLHLPLTPPLDDGRKIENREQNWESMTASMIASNRYQPNIPAAKKPAPLLCFE